MKRGREGAQGWRKREGELTPREKMRSRRLCPSVLRRYMHGRRGIWAGYDDGAPSKWTKEGRVK